MYEQDFLFQLLIEAEAYYSIDAHHESRKRLEVYLHHFPMAANAHCRLGCVWYALDQPNKALFYFIRAHELDQNNIEYVINLADQLLELDQDERAVEILTQFFKNNRDDKLIVLGHAYLERIPYLFVKKCWKKSFEPSLKVASSKPNDVLDTVK